MKRLRQSVALLFAIIFIFHATAFDQKVEASTEKSSVGIKFEGSIPQTDESTKQSENRSRPKNLPQTNEKSEVFITGSGLILLSLSVCFVIYEKKKGQRK